MYINTHHRLPYIRLSGRVHCYVSGQLHGARQEEMAQPLKVCHMWFSRGEHVLDRAEGGSDLRGGITPHTPSPQTFVSYYHDKDLETCPLKMKLMDTYLLVSLFAWVELKVKN